MGNQQVALFDQEGAGALSTKFRPLVAAGIGNDLGEGIRGSYGIVGVKGGKFRLKYKGEETVLLDPTTRTPVGYIDVVIVKANAFLNKQYFEGKYEEGAKAAPVCYSLDGIKPSDQSVKKQHTNCALCPKNQFGSAMGENGAKMKACRDTKKLAVVPLADIRNIAMGGAMLFRVPPSSLKDLSAMADALKSRGYPYNSVAVRISFDLDASYPKPVFKAIRPLTDDEADLVIEMFESDSVLRVLGDNDVAAEHGEQPAQSSAPVAPAGAHESDPRYTSTAPVPQQPAMPPVMPPPPNAADVQQNGFVVQPVGNPAATIAMPPPAQPRVLRVKPDDEPAPAPAAANPFAQAPTPVQSPPAPAQQTAAPNPFAPPPAAPTKRQRAAKAQAAEPVTVESTATEVPQPQQESQLNADINSILAGLEM